MDGSAASWKPGSGSDHPFRKGKLSHHSETRSNESCWQEIQWLSFFEDYQSNTNCLNNDMTKSQIEGEK